MDVGNLVLYVSLFVSLFFEIFLLITYLEVRSEIEQENAWVANGPTSFPSVTVIVPSYNEEKTVRSTIASLLNLNYPKDKLSLILVNDGSTDKTLEVFKEFDSNLQVRILDKVNGGKHTAVNLALKQVTSDLVGCLDADSFVTPDTLNKIVPYFEDLTIAAVTPAVKIHEPETVLQHIQRIEYNWGIFFRRMLSSMGAIYVTPGPFSIFRTQVLKEVGGYRNAYKTEDLEMALRLQKGRYKIANSHGAHVYTVAPAKFPALFKQRVRWTYGFLNNAIDYREMFFNRKYGNVGVFVLPIAVTSIFSTLYGTGNAVWAGASKAVDGVVKFNTIGLDWKLHSPSFDWYFLNTSVMTFLTTTAILLTIVIVFLSMRMSEGRARLTKGVIYYLVLYIFLAPTWLVKALWNTIRRKEVVWR